MSKSHFLDAGYDTEANVGHSRYGMDYPGGKRNTPINTPAEFGEDAVTPPVVVVAAPVVPKHHGHPVVKSIGAGALAGGIATALKVGAMASGGIGIAAAAITYLITKPHKK